MVDWTAVSALAASVAVVVTLVIFITQSARRRREDRETRKREAISRLLISLEESIRKNQGLLSSLRFWRHPDVEYVLSVPRLFHDLGPENRHVSDWALSQVQQMIAATSDKKAARIGVAMNMKIVEWGQGTVDDDWFRGQLIAHPVESAFKVPKKRQLLRLSNRTLNSTLAVAVLAFTIKAGYSGMRDLLAE